MNDLISRQDAIDAIFGRSHEIIKMRIEKLPSAQLERKKGKWQWLASTYDRIPCEKRYMCSECHHETITFEREPWERFCPNCGAEMDQTVGSK